MGRLSVAGAKLASALGFGALGAGAIAAASKFQDAGITIQRSTGATGERLAGLEKSFANVYKQTAASSDAVSTTLALLSTRTGATGKDLEDLTLKTIKLAKTQREDVATIVPLVTRAFGDWSIATKDQAKAMDFLRVSSQQSGTAVSRLAEQVVYAGAPFRQLGFNFEQATTLIAKFEKEGVNTELVVGGMKAALQKFAKDGITDTAGAWKSFVEGVRSGRLTLTDVLKEVGAKRGVDLFKAIQEARFEIDEMVRSSEKLATQAAPNTETLKTSFTKLQHQIEAAIAAHKDLILVVGIAGPAFVGFGKLALSALGGVAAQFGTSKLAAVALGSSTYELGGTFTATGRTIAAAGETAALGWTGMLRIAGVLAAAAAVGWYLGKSGPSGSSGNTDAARNSIPDMGPAKDDDFWWLKKPNAAAAPTVTPPKVDYETAKIQIDAALAHSKALIDIKRSQYEEEERLGKISAAKNLDRLRELEEQELRLTLAAIDRKLALSKEKNEGKVDASLLATRQAALDHSAAQEIKLQQHVTAEEEKQFDERVKYHVQGENAKLQATEKALDERIKYHVQGLNAELKFDQDVAAHVRELNERMADDRVRAASIGVAGEAEHQTRVLELRRQQAEFEEQIGLISAKEKIRILNSVDAEEEALQRKAIQREIELLDERIGIDTDYASKKQALENRLQTFEDRHRANEQKNLNNSISDFSRWVLRLRSSVGTVESAFRTLGQITQRAFDQFAQGMGQNIAHAIIYGESIGKAVKNAAVAVIESLAAQALGYAAFATALGFYNLAMLNFPAATAAFTAAAIFGSIGVIAAVVGSALVPKDQKAGHSAAGGFDVGDIAPVTQLHPREMVLPADIAVPLRAQLRNGGVGTGGVQIHIGSMHGVARETVDLLANKIIRGARFAGARI